MIADYYPFTFNPLRRNVFARIERKWILGLVAIRRWVCGVLLLTTISGCNESLWEKSLPSPIHDGVEYVKVGRVDRIGGSDHFEFTESGGLHYVVIRGVDSPKPGQSYFRRARGSLWKMVRNNDIRVEVVDREASMIEVADVFVINDDPADIEGDLNVGLELIRRGMGWFDGTEFELSELYQQAELEAKTNKIGLWSEPDPVPPWEFESARQTQLDEQMNF